jgi:Citrate transporter
MSVATAFSMFITETTVVLVFLPVILGVCKERNLSPSRYLLCAAYGAALGGQWTLIGTRSSIIVSDFLHQRTGHGIGFFDFTPIAAPVFVGCAIYFFLFGRRFLPKAELQSLEQELGKEYLTEVMVTPQSTTVGLTLDQLDWAKRQDITIVGIILTAVTGVLTPALSVPLAAIAALLLGCVKVNDTYKSVNWQAVATVGGMMSLGLALEKTGAAGALAHLIVTNLQWAGPNVILCALLALTVAMTQLIENAAVAIILSPIAYPNCARVPRGSKVLHGRVGNLYFNVVLHARRARDHNAGDGSWPVPLQALPCHRQRNGRYRLADHHVRDTDDLEVLIRHSATRPDKKTTATEWHIGGRHRRPFSAKALFGLALCYFTWFPRWRVLS